MARRPRYPRSPDELPAWLATLPGWNDISACLPDITTFTPSSSGRFEMRSHIIIDSTTSSDVHPLVGLAALVYNAARLDDGISLMVQKTRDAGASWTQIGDVLGITKQAAWERYSGED
jgi:hypothetical protein